MAHRIVRPTWPAKASQFDEQTVLNVLDPESEELPMSEWIRPAGCEGGACVEYRTEGAAVYVRSSAAPDRMVGFTAAEWDAFVAGLTAEVTAERDIARKDAEQMRLVLAIQGGGIDPSGFYAGTPGQRLRDLEAAEVERDNLAAENARLRQDLGKAERERDSLARRCAVRFDETTRLREASNEVIEFITKARNEAIAEAAVLRLKVRRMQPVVEAATALHAGFAARKPGGGSAELCGLERAVEDYLKVPTEPPASPLPPDQPPVEALATDGAGAQGEAQGAAEASWTSPVHTTSAAEADGWQVIQGFVNRLRRDVELMQETFGEVAVAFSNTPMPPDVTPGSHMSMTVRTPRVWNAGDPEPEGVLSVCDKDGDRWVSPKTKGQNWRIVGASDEARWRELVDTWAPLTEVLLEPTRPPGSMAGPVVVGDQILGEFADGWPLATHGANENLKVTPKPDGEVPEAGRAGEAQERTEGLDAAIVAALPAFREGWIEWGRPLRSCIEAAVRAASPLIERDALLAAADDVAAGRELDVSSEDRAVILGWLRDRAGRTVAS